MEELQFLIDYFIKNEGPWAVLFVLFLVYTQRQQAKREDRNHQETSEALNQIQKDTALMIETWKIIIERELERRKNE